MGTITASRKPRLLLRAKKGSINRFAVLKFLKELKRHRRGRKLLFFWDGLAAHRAKIVSQFILENRSWLRLERLPAYAPELNPVEYFWSALKKRSGNGTPEVDALMKHARKARRRFSDSKLLAGFLKASGLYD